MQEEKYGSRDLTYSAWHRRLSTQRFVGIEDAQLLSMIDLDSAIWVEFEDGNFEAVALVELARDTGQRNKCAAVTQNLAKRCTPLLPAYTVLYTPSEKANNPAEPTCPDIVSFRIRRLWPDPEQSWTKYSPEEYARFLLKLRRRAAAIIDESLKPPPNATTPEEFKTGDYNGNGYRSGELTKDKPQPEPSQRTSHTRLF